MESLTIELCVAEGDPLDRTYGILIRSGETLVMARSIRIDPQVRIGQVLIEIDRIVLAWALPQLREQEHINDVWETGAERLSGPF